MTKNPLTALRKVFSSGKLLFICIIFTVGALANLYGAVSDSPDLTKLGIFGMEIELGEFLPDEVMSVLEGVTTFLLVMSIIGVLPQLATAVALWLIRGGKEDNDGAAKRACLGFTLIKAQSLFKILTCVAYLVGVLVVALLAVVAAGRIASSSTAIWIIVGAALLIASYFVTVINYHSKLMTMFITVTNTLRTGKNTVRRFGQVTAMNWFFAAYYVISGFTGEAEDIVAGFCIGAVYLFMNFLFSDFRDQCGWADVGEVKEYMTALPGDPARSETAHILGYRRVATPEGEKTLITLKGILSGQFFGISLSSVRRQEAEGELESGSVYQPLDDDDKTDEEVATRADFSSAPTYKPSVLRLFDRDGAEDRFKDLDYVIGDGDLYDNVLRISTVRILRDSVSDQLLMKLGITNLSPVEAVGIRFSFSAQGQAGILGITSDVEASVSEPCVQNGEMLTELGVTLPAGTDKLKLTVSSLIFADGLRKDGLSVNAVICSRGRLAQDKLAAEQRAIAEAQAQEQLVKRCQGELDSLESRLVGVGAERDGFLVTLGISDPYKKPLAELDELVRSASRIKNISVRMEVSERASALKSKFEALHSKFLPKKKSRLTTTAIASGALVAAVLAFLLPAIIIPSVKLAKAEKMREDGRLVEAYYAVKGMDIQKAIKHKEELKREIEYFVLPESVNVIDEREFEGFENIKEIILHSEVEHVGFGAFASSSKVTRLVLPNGATSVRSIFGMDAYADYYFGATNTLTTVEVLGGDEIADHFLDGFTAVTEVTLPSTVTSVGADAFAGCESLPKVELPSGVTYIGYDAFKNCKSFTSFALPDGVTRVGGPILEGCEGLRELTYHSVFIDNYNNGDDSTLRLSVFGFTVDNSSLKRVTVTKAEEIDEDCFAGFSSIESILIPEGVTEICDGAFSGCASLTELRMPSSLKTVGSYAFEYTRLERVIIDPVSWSQVQIYDIWAHPTPSEGYFIEEAGGVKPLTELVLPVGVSAVADYVFMDCTTLKRVVLPAGLQRVGEYSFHGCTSLEALELNSGLKTIGQEAFRYAAIGGTLTFPDTLEIIEQYAFGNCAYITAVELNEGLKIIDDQVFYMCERISELDVPDSVTAMGRQEDMNSLVRVRLGKLLSVLPGDAFRDCVRLSEVYDCSAVGVGASLDGGSYYGYLFNYYTPSSGESRLRPVGDFLFYENADGNVYLVDYTGEGGAIVLPDYFDGKEYVLWRYCLAYEDGITSVTFSKGVKYQRGMILYHSPAVSQIKADPDSEYYYAEGNCLIFKEYQSLELGCKSSYIPDTVRILDWEAFVGCTGLEEIRIPASVENNGSNFAFRGCTSLKRVWIDCGFVAGGGMFEDCTSLEEVHLKDGTTFIGSDAFNGCTSLKYVNIPTSVTEIGERAFEGCTELVILDEYGCSYVGRWLVNYDRQANTHGTSVTVKGDTVGIASYAFSYCELTEIELPEGLKYISSSAFASCDTLTEITIPSTVVYLGGGAFSNCTGLERVSVAFGSQLKRIDNSAFASCTALASINIPASVEELGYDCFNGCDKLFDKAEGVWYVDNWAYSHDEGITAANMRQGTVGIADYAFDGCKTLASVTLPDSLRYIGEWAFGGCTALTSAELNDGLLVLGYDCFGGSGVKELLLPTSIVRMRPFEYSDGARVYFQGTREQFAAKGEDFYNVGVHYYSATQPVEDSNGFIYPSWHYVDGVPTPW